MVYYTNEHLKNTATVITSHTHQLRPTLQQDVTDDGVAVSTGVGEGSVEGVGLSVHIGPSLKKELDDVHVALLSGFHQRSGGSQFNVST